MSKIFGIRIVNAAITFLMVLDVFGQMDTHHYCGSSHFKSSDHIYQYRSSEWIDTIYIPVVFHILYHDEITVSAEQVISQITATNNHLLQSGSYDLGSSIPIKLQLTMINPEGQPSSGIEYIQSEQVIFDTDFSIPMDEGVNTTMKYDSLGGCNAWPSDKYLNVWVCDLETGVKGFSSFPDQFEDALDGIVIGKAFFGTLGSGTTYPTYSEGKSLTHELGHWLNLNHIWGEVGCDIDDGVEDTPSQNAYYFGCPNYKYSCNSEDMLENFMQYTDDTCTKLFTEGQKTRMYNSLNSNTQRTPFMFDELSVISGASLSNMAEPVNVGVYDQNNNLVNNFTVESNGEFISPYLPAGTYILKIEGQPLDNYVFNGNTVTLNQSNPITLKQGQQTSEITLSTIPTFNLSGEIADNITGFNIKDIQVDIYDLSGTQLQSTFTDASGTFEFVDLIDGEYYIQIWPGDNYVFSQDQGIIDHSYGYGTSQSFLLSSMQSNHSVINLEPQTILSLNILILTYTFEQNSDIVLSWNDISDARSYSLEKWDPINEQFETITTTQEHTYTYAKESNNQFSELWRVVSDNAVYSEAIVITYEATYHVPKNKSYLINSGSEISIHGTLYNSELHCFNSNGKEIPIQVDVTTHNTKVIQADFEPGVYFVLQLLNDVLISRHTIIVYR